MADKPKKPIKLSEIKIPKLPEIKVPKIVVPKIDLSEFERIQQNLRKLRKLRGL